MSRIFFFSIIGFLSFNVGHSYGEELTGSRKFSFEIKKTLGGDANPALNVLNVAEKELKSKIQEICNDDKTHSLDLAIVMNSGAGRFCARVNPKGKLSGDRNPNLLTAVKIGYCYPELIVTGTVDCAE